jgi:energy-coupling factor transporter ATP-binding protein EcfA2
MSKNNEEYITFIGETDFRNRRTRFGILEADRSKHMYIIGKTGMGKSTLIENLLVQDIQAGHGVAFIDPHGSSAEKILDFVPRHRIEDVIYFAPFDHEHPIAFNVMEDVGKDKRHLVVSGLMSVFKKIWVDAWSARMEYILANTLLALLEYPGSTLLGVNRMLTDKFFRKKVIEHITDASVRSFWIDEYNKWDDRYAKEAGAAIQNKIGQFTANPIIRNIVGQPKSTFDIREIMDNKKILVMNLSKGLMGEQNAELIGGMLITKLYLAAMSRADQGEAGIHALPPLYFYVDEFQSFANESFADILSEARKYKLSLTIAHQYIAQMPEPVRDAVFGNVGSMVTFRVGATDAEFLEREFIPVFTAEDIVNLGFAQIYLRLMIRGIGSRPFSAKTLPPIEKPAMSFKRDIIEYSRTHFARSRDSVEHDIDTWFAPIASGTPESKEPSFKKKPFPKSPEPSMPRTPQVPTKPYRPQGESRPPLHSTPRPAPSFKKPTVMHVHQEKQPETKPVAKPVPQSISLDTLASKVKQNDISQVRSGITPSKNASPDAKQALQSVLQKALSTQTLPDPSTPPQRAPRPPSPAEPHASPSPKEIPEHVLRSVLQDE